MSLMWVLPLLLIIPNIVLDITEYSSPLVKIANILLPWGVYMLLTSWSKNVGRTVLFMLPLIIYAAFQIVLLYLYGESIIAVDMFINLVTTNPEEAGELLGNLALAIITVCLAYLPPIGWAIYLIRSKRYTSVAFRRRGRRTGFIMAGIGLIMVFVCYGVVKPFNISRDIFPINVINNTITAAKRVKATARYYQTSSDFSYQASATHPIDTKEIYVIVVGETSRADNWELFGYDRPTNPRLSKRSDRLILFPKTLSESNTTHKSVPLMLSCCTAENFGDSIYTSKSIVSAFNEAGFRTGWLSNQGRNHSFIDFFAREAQTTTFLTDDGQHHYDIDLIAPMKEFIENSPNNKLFIVLHSYGSHFNYRDRLPADDIYFTPDDNSEASFENREQLLNAYDNTIRYTDRFLDSVITVIDNQDCVASVLYASDHGEDIFDDRRHRFLHASPVPTYNQLHVPMFIWTSEEYDSVYPEKVETARSHKDMNVSSSRTVFDTMLELGGIRSAYARTTKSLANPDYNQGRRRYVNDYNEGVDLKSAGFRSFDYDNLIKHEISAH